MPKLIDYSGSKYGYLTLLRSSHPNPQGVGTTWTARCDCGRVIEVIARDVARGRKKSCGTCEYHSALKGKKTLTRKYGTVLLRLYGQYSKRARKYSPQKVLSIEEYSAILVANCAYCGSGPSYKLLPGKGKAAFLYNLPARVDMDSDWSPANTVACCNLCTRVRAGLNLRDFLTHVQKIASHISTELQKVAPPTNNS